METQSRNFAIDLGTTQPTSVPMEVITVTIASQTLLGDYAKAFLNEARRVNPLRAEQVELTREELERYCEFLLERRIRIVHGDCPDYRKLKQLYIPAFIQYNLAMIGRVIVREYGLTFEPEYDGREVMTFEEALVISNKLGAFENDLQILLDAMPRDQFGDSNVMSTALIAGYVRATKKVEHPIDAYVAAFLGMKLKEEMMWQVFYRVQYDDYEYIRTALTLQKGLY